MTERRCQECGEFYNQRLPVCPDCGAEKYPYNEALVSQRWRTNLNRQAEHAVKHT